MTIYKRFILTAGKKSKGSDSKKRSNLLKVVMKEISGDRGKELANAIEAKDLEKFKGLWSSATNGIIAQLEKEFNVGKSDA